MSQKPDTDARKSRLALASELVAVIQNPLTKQWQRSNRLLEAQRAAVPYGYPFKDWSKNERLKYIDSFQIRRDAHAVLAVVVPLVRILRYAGYGVGLEEALRKLVVFASEKTDINATHKIALRQLLATFGPPVFCQVQFQSPPNAYPLDLVLASATPASAAPGRINPQALYDQIVASCKLTGEQRQFLATALTSRRT